MLTIPDLDRCPHCDRLTPVQEAPCRHCGRALVVAVIRGVLRLVRERRAA